MPTLKEGDRVRVISATGVEDKKAGLYQQMIGLTGVVENYYSEAEIAVKVDLDSLSRIEQEVHTTSTQRMRAKTLDALGESAKSFDKEELEFTPNYVILVRAQDLERA